MNIALPTTFTAAFMIFSGASAMAACEEEYVRTRALPQSPIQAEQNEQYRQMASNPELLEIDFDWKLKTLAVKAHFSDNPSSPGRHRFYSDKFPLSACLLRLLADDRSKFYAPYALEGYALKLLAGDGVSKDRDAAIRYLTKSSESWHWGSAAVRLGRLYLDGKPSASEVDKAVYFLKRAIQLAPNTEGGSENPSDAYKILFDVYLSGKYRSRDVPAAIRLYQTLRTSKYPDDDLLRRIAAQEPAVAAAVRQEATQAPVDSRQRRIEECEERKKFEGYSATIRCQKVWLGTSSHRSAFHICRE